MKTQKLKLDDIRIDGGTQVRVEIDEGTVADYADQINSLPPVVVFHDGSTLWLADGFHRWHGHRRAGLVTIVAEVRQGSREDAAWFALAANKAHGLRMSNADKRAAVQKALALRPGISSRQIAEHVGVSDHTVRSVREEVAPVAQNAQLVGKGGKPYPAKRQATDGKQVTDDPPLVTDETPPVVTDDDGGLAAVQADLRDLEDGLRAWVRQAREVLGVKGKTIKRPWCRRYDISSITFAAERICRIILDDMPVGGTAKKPVLARERKAAEAAGRNKE
jgi:ParB-like chromosome segregation protein Spo0J